jgi:hypothetical protein
MVLEIEIPGKFRIGNNGSLKRFSNSQENLLNNILQ